MRTISGGFDGKGLRVGIAVSRFNDAVTRQLLTGAIETLARLGVSDDAVTVVWSPGAFELPFFARLLAGSGEADAVIVLGAVIRGDTSHYELVCARAANGAAAVSDEFELPVIFGVLTTETFEQAMDRAGGKHGNKGWDAAMAAMETADVLDRLPKREAGPE